MSGFSEPAIKEICSRKDREIHLFNRIELQGMVDGRLSFRELLKKKREWLRMHGSPFLLESIPSSVPPFQLRCEPDVFEIGGSLAPWLRIRTGSNDLIFSNELLDFSGRQLHSTFSLELQPRAEGLHDLRRLLNVVQNLFGLSGQGPFSISQSGEGWFGYGLNSFLSAAEQQQKRYDELNWQRYHSEQLAYLDRLETGGMICVKSQQSTGTGRGHLHSTFLEMYLPGMPVDSLHIRELCKIVRNEDACLEFVKDNPVFESAGENPGPAYRQDSLEYPRLQIDIWAGRRESIPELCHRCGE
jgi:hypothetical protein